MKKELVDVLNELNANIKKQYAPAKQGKYDKEIRGLIEKYTTVETQERHEETYVSLMKRGKELIKVANLKDEKKLQYFLRYCHAAYYDFTDNIKPLNWLIRSYMITVMFFYIMAPQYYGYILPLIMVVPIFIGLRGMKKRSLNGLITGCAVVPLAIMVGVTHLKFMSMAISGGYDAYLAAQAAQYNLPVEAASSLLSAFNLISLVMIGAGVFTAYLGIKHNKMFI